MAETNSPPKPAEATISATYTSPTNNPFTFTAKVPTPPTASAADRSSYFRSLREEIESLQDQINKQLTARMEEDKARTGTASNGVGNAAPVDEEKEEENYGEEGEED